MTLDGKPFTSKEFDDEEAAQIYVKEMAQSLFPFPGLGVVEERVEECDWKDYVEDSYDLYFVNYGDDLNDHYKVLQECLQENNDYPLNEALFEWWESPESYEMDKIQNKMTDDGFEEEYLAHEDDIREWLWEHDKSEPIKDLLRNTAELAIYYDLGYEADGWHEAFLCNPWRNTTEKQEVANIRRFFGIRKDSEQDKKLQTIISEASYGGNLRIYFPMDDFYSMLTFDDNNDFQTIRFDGTFAVGVINSVNGSGWYEDLEIHCEFPFNRKNLIFSKMDHYSVEEVYGHFDSWAKDYSFPTFLKRKPLRKLQIKDSVSSAEIARQVEYDRVYKAGGCTLGDTDMRRHRDVYYLNEFPCGSHCPHCGQFWID